MFYYNIIIIRLHKEPSRPDSKFQGPYINPGSLTIRQRVRVCSGSMLVTT